MRLSAATLIRFLAVFFATATVSVFVLLSTRGLDLTDESYYLLNFLHWRDLASIVTFFGAFFEYPFRWLNYDIVAIRVLGLVLLVFASCYFIHAALVYVERLTKTRLSVDKLTLVLAGLSVSMVYYRFFGTLRVPSYNTLTLIGILVSTGVVFKNVSVAFDKTSSSKAGFTYGLLVAALVFVKATSAVGMVVVHLVIFVAHRGRTSLSASQSIAYGAVPAVLLVLGVLTYLHPDWWSVLRTGLELINARDSHSNLVINGVTQFRWDLQIHLADHWPTYAFVGLCHLLVTLGPGRKNRSLIHWWIVILGLGLMAFFSLSERTTTCLPEIVFVSLLLWSIEPLLREPLRPARSDLVVVGLVIISAALSLSFSWGSSMGMLAHSQLAATLQLAGLFVVVTRLKALQILNEQGFRAVVLILVVLGFAIAGRPWWDIDATYRLNASLAQQGHALVVGDESRAVTVDDLTRQDVQEFRQVLRSSGFDQGDGMLDLTGDSPGLVYLAGGRPLGVAWLLGGYPGSSEQARKLIGLLEPDVWRCAWLLTSEDAARRIVGWESILRDDYDVFDHVKAGELTIHTHYKWRGAKAGKMTLAIWRPAALDCV